MAVTKFTRKRHRSAALRHCTMLLAAGMMAIALTGCGDKADEPIAENENALELAAAERGLIGAPLSEPMGILERRRDDGRDRMCVVRGSDGDDQTLRFAMELRAKDGGTCLTGGSLLVDEPVLVGGGDDAADDGLAEGASRTWTLRFRGLDGCEVKAVEQGDALSLPEALPASCAKLCAGRLSLDGAEMERTSWSEEEAQILRLRGADGRIQKACAKGISR